MRWSLFLLLVVAMSAGCQTNSGTRQVYAPTAPTPKAERGNSSKPKSKSKPTVLENRLSGSNAAERVGAAVILLARSDRKSSDLVRRYLQDHDSELPCSALIEALRIDPKPEYAELVVVNLSSPSRLCREAATGTLAVYDRSVVGPLLLARLKASEPDADTRRRIITVLGKVGEQRAIEPLLEALARPELTSTASGALKNITGEDFKNPRQWHEWWQQNLSPNQMEWFRRELATQRHNVTELRAELETERKRKDLAEEQVTEFLLKTLRQRDPANDPDLLIEALQMPYEKVRLFAANELGRLKKPEATQTLSSVALVDPRPAVRVAAVNALVQIDARKVVPTLKKALQDVEATVAAAAATGLGKAGAKSALRPLLMALLHKSSRLRSASAEALGQIGDKRAVRSLLRALGSDDAIEVREQAAKALGTLKASRAVPALVRALDAREASLRVFAVDALGEIGDPSVVKRLSQMLMTASENPGVRESSAVALGKLADAEALSALKFALRKGDEKLQQLAFGALADICRPNTELLYQTAGELMTGQDYARATQLFELLIETSADKPGLAKTVALTRRDLSRCYLAQEQWSKAVKLLEDIKRTNPADVAILTRYARALRGAKKWPESFRQYSELARLNKNQKVSYWSERLSLLETMMRLERYKQVMELIDEVRPGLAAAPENVGVRIEAIRKICHAKSTVSADKTAEMANLVRLFDNNNATKREEILKKLTEQSNLAWPALITGLADENPKIRRGCFELLHRAAGKTFDYDPDGPPETRAKAVELWRTWLKTATKTAEPAAP